MVKRKARAPRPEASQPSDTCLQTVMMAGCRTCALSTLAKYDDATVIYKRYSRLRPREGRTKVDLFGLVVARVRDCGADFLNGTMRTVKVEAAARAVGMEDRRTTLTVVAVDASDVDRVVTGHLTVPTRSSSSSNRIAREARRSIEEEEEDEAGAEAARKVAARRVMAVSSAVRKVIGRASVLVRRGERFLLYSTSSALYIISLYRQFCKRR